MIDTATGRILLTFGGIRVEPSLTREWLLASREASELRENVRNEPYCSYDLPTAHWNGHSFACSLWFKSSTLQRVSICCADAQFGSSWSDWSQEKEMERKRLHDEMLESILGADWRKQHFAWGVVSSDYDSKGGFSSIEIAYSPSSTAGQL